ncbi:hypothetical protein BDR05DRAFT_884437 [Suillus weaverae]|nr:hypothetical protein BDR05DRAFT_884437 [Suillus weaverae]
MILSLYAILFCIPFVCASLQNINDTCIYILDSGSASSNNTRALWDILLSCGWTLFACTWTAVHPNIPGMNEGKVAIISRRLFIMAMALIAPELMITWATRQFFSARAAAKDFNDYLDTQPTKVYGDRWTITHGFFVWMGGFMLCVNDEPRATLTPDNLLHFVDEGSVDMPVISQVEVEDRSKGDGLSKGISILQLAWFVVQLFARYVQNLPITLLEIDTLAIAALTCISYGLWWKKPKDVGCPCIVHWKGTANQLNRLTYKYVVYIFALNCSDLPAF